jgi:hypothetical protein
MNGIDNEFIDNTYGAENNDGGLDADLDGRQ